MSAQPTHIEYENQSSRQHSLALGNEQMLLHRKVMSSVLSDTRVQRAFDSLDSIENHKTRAHSIEVGRLATAGAIVLQMDYREIEICMAGAVLHDIGKSRPDISKQVKSTEPITNPAVYEAIREHPAVGAKMARKLGIGENVARIIGGHHALQTVRQSYGEDIPLVGVEQGDGFVPKVADLTAITAAADMLDALTLDSPNRPYQRREESGITLARWFIRTLDTSSEIKDVMCAIVDY